MNISHEKQASSHHEPGVKPASARLHSSSFADYMCGATDLSLVLSLIPTISGSW